VKNGVKNGMIALSEFPLPALLVDGKSFLILDCNRQANALYDRTTSEMLASTLLDLTLPVEHGALRQSFNSSIEHTKELHQLRRNGTVIQVEFTRTSIPAKDGTNWVCLLHDVTSRSRLVRALLESDAEHREIIDNANDIIYTHDLKGISLLSTVP